MKKSQRERPAEEGLEREERFLQTFVLLWWLDFQRLGAMREIFLILRR